MSEGGKEGIALVLTLLITAGLAGVATGISLALLTKTVTKQKKLLRPLS